jgi:hypothetical protein
MAIHQENDYVTRENLAIQFCVSLNSMKIWGARAHAGNSVGTNAQHFPVDWNELSEL